MKTDKDVDKLWHDIKKYEDALKRKQEELTELIDKLKSKQCDIPDVSQQRELLKAFYNWHVENRGASTVLPNEIDEYLNSL